MPEVTTCPDCEKKLKVPDELLGKKVKCPGCSVMFTARADDADEPAEEEAPARKTREKASARADGISTRKRDLDEEDDRPRAKSRKDEEEDRPRAKSRRDDEDEVDERPRSKSRRDDEDEEEKPRGAGIRRREDVDDRPSRRVRNEDEDDRRRSRRDDDEDHPRRRSRGWAGVRIGIFLVIISKWLQLAGLGFMVIAFGTMLLMGGAFLSTMMGGANSGRISEGGAAAAGGLAILGFILLFLGGGLYVIGSILEIVGQGFCIQAENGTLRGLAIATVACSVVALMINFGGYAVNASNYSGGLAGLINTAAFVCWCLFLRGAANELRDSDLAGKFLTYLISYFVAGAVFVVLFIITICAGVAGMAGAAGNQNAGGAATAGGAMVVVLVLLYAVAGLVYLGLMVWNVMLLQRLRALIGQRIDRD